MVGSSACTDYIIVNDSECYRTTHLECYCIAQVNSISKVRRAGQCHKILSREYAQRQNKPRPIIRICLRRGYNTIDNSVTR
jgi:hypothetical protein